MEKIYKTSQSLINSWNPLSVVYKQKWMYYTIEPEWRILFSELHDAVVWNMKWSICIDLINKNSIDIRILWFNNHWILIKNRWYKRKQFSWHSYYTSWDYRWKRTPNDLITFASFVIQLPNHKATFILWETLFDMIYSSKEFIPFYKQNAVKTKYTKYDKQIVTRKVPKFPEEFNQKYKTVLWYCNKANSLLINADTNEDFIHLDDIINIIWNEFTSFIAKSENDITWHKMQIFEKRNKFMTSKEFVSLWV